MDESSSIRRTQEHLVYENPYLRFYDDYVHFPDGHEGRYVRVKWKPPYSVAVLPVTKNNEIVLIRQFNYARSKWMLQVPKGMGEDVLDPCDCARKELAEEAGFAASSFHLLANLYTDPGFIENPTYLFLAKDVVPSGPTAHEPAEVIGCTELIPLATALQPEWLCEISDALTLLAILHYSHRGNHP